jgi:hypothetical protein
MEQQYGCLAVVVIAIQVSAASFCLDFSVVAVTGCALVARGFVSQKMRLR